MRHLIDIVFHEFHHEQHEFTFLYMVSGICKLSNPQHYQTARPRPIDQDEQDEDEDDLMVLMVLITVLLDHQTRSKNDRRHG